VKKLKELALRFQIRQEYEQQYEPVIAQLAEAKERIQELEEVRDDLLKELKSLKRHLRNLSES
jgi:tetrahydromethanopterin S-methyltransferase subunit B